LDGTWSGVLCRGSPGRDFFVTGCLHSTKLVSSSGFGGRDRHCTRTDRDLFYSIGFVFTMQVQQGTASIDDEGDTSDNSASHDGQSAAHVAWGSFSSVNGLIWRKETSPSSESHPAESRGPEIRFPPEAY
jgi:hypothetical protein